MIIPPPPTLFIAPPAATDRLRDAGSKIGRVRQSVCFHFIFLTEEPLVSIVAYDVSTVVRGSPGIENKGHRSWSRRVSAGLGLEGW